MLAPQERWRELAGLQKARRDFPTRELVTILLLIVAVWVVDVFVLRDAYDQDYFIVQRSVREANDHCRDMVIDRRARGVYEVRTCGELRVYELEGNEAKKVEVREIGGDGRGRR